MLLINSLDSRRKDVLETFKHMFEVLGYKVILLKATEISISIKKEWQGHRWCLNGRMEGNATVESPCFQRNDLFLLQENQRVSCCIYLYMYLILITYFFTLVQNLKDGVLYAISGVTSSRHGKTTSKE